MTTDDTPSTPQQHADIRAAAEARVRYILWLARELDRRPTRPPSGLQSEAAAALRHLVGPGE